MAMPPDYLPKALAGLAPLAKNGLSYPIPQYGIQSDARAGLGFGYKDVKQAVLPEPALERFRGCAPAIRPIARMQSKDVRAGNASPPGRGGRASGRH